MKPLSTSELYDTLCDKVFQDTVAGDMQYNFFVYQYPAENEYRIRKEIAEIKEKISHPEPQIDILALDMFEEFCSFLDGRPFGKKYASKLKYLLEKEESMPETIENSLINEAGSDAFLNHIHDKIISHVEIIDQMKRPYVFLYGFGFIYPYLRASYLLNRYESVNESGRYKIILFYPGVASKSSYKLFSVLEDDHTYRANLLIND